MYPDVSDVRPIEPCGGLESAGGARLLKAIAHKELTGIFNDDGLSLHSEMLIVKVPTRVACYLVDNLFFAKSLLVRA